MIPWQSDDMNWASWVVPLEPLVTMPWALRGISAGAIRSTVMVEDDDEENRSVSKHIRFEQKVGTVSNNMVMGRTNLSRCMVPMNWSSP